ncbi:TPA: acyltransferase family protein [Enterobacter cloacae]
MEIKQRDYYIDNVRGLATLSVIFIHTVFWSGVFYVPDYMRIAALFFDVPVFFLLTGFVFKSTGKIDSLRQSVKIAYYFFVFTLIMNTLTFNLNIDQLIGAITFNSANIPVFPVVNGSYWFVPMYISSIIIAHALIKTLGEKTKFIIPMALLYYFVGYFADYKLHYTMLGININSLLFYVSLILVGYNFYGLIGKRKSFIYLAIFFILFILLINYNNDAIRLQKYKLNLSLPYVLASSISVAFIFTGLLTRKKSLLSWIGQRAIYFYMAQGIGASVIYIVVHKLKLDWIPKLLIMFSINLAVTFIVVTSILKIISMTETLCSRKFFTGPRAGLPVKH